MYINSVLCVIVAYSLHGMIACISSIAKTSLFIKCSDTLKLAKQSVARASTYMNSVLLVIVAFSLYAMVACINIQ